MQEHTGPPEGRVTADTLAAEYGVSQASLAQARRMILELQSENVALRKANEKMAEALEAKQKPDGVPAGSAPRRSRRPIQLAQRRAAAKAHRKGETDGDATTG